MTRILRLIICISIIRLFVLASTISAQVVVNEFSSGSLSDWVEIYVLPEATVSVDLSQYRLRDLTENNKKDLEGELEPGDFKTFDFGRALNKDGDVIKLVKLNGESEEVIFQIAYGSEGGVCAPSEMQSVGRKPDGSGSFVRFVSQTRDAANLAGELACPTPTPMPAPTKEPTSSPSPEVTATPATQKPTPSPTKKPTVKPAVIVEDEEVERESVVLGETDILDGEKEEEEKQKEGKAFPWLAILFVVAGLGFVGAGLYPLYRPYLEKYNLRIRGKRKENS